MSEFFLSFLVFGGISYFIASFIPQDKTLTEEQKEKARIQKEWTLLIISVVLAFIFRPIGRMFLMLLLQ